MGLRQVNVDNAITYLNHLLALDPHWVTALITTQALCNDSIAESEVRVRDTHGICYCGVLGLLNGLFGMYEEGEYAGYGPIAAQFEGESIVRFIRTPVSRTVV